jgi:hypothetical protein
MNIEEISIVVNGNFIYKKIECSSIYKTINGLSQEFICFPRSLLNGLYRETDSITIESGNYDFKKVNLIFLYSV